MDHSWPNHRNDLQARYVGLTFYLEASDQSMKPTARLRNEFTSRICNPLPAELPGERCRAPDSFSFIGSSVLRILIIRTQPHFYKLSARVAHRLTGFPFGRSFTFRPKCYEPKQRFEGSACAKSLGPDRRKVNSPRAQVKGDCLL
jgi:hypothetical protein